MTKARDLANAADVLDDVSATELSYVNGVTSAIQTQLNAKQATVANVNDTEIGYLDGVTSAIQTQLDAKVAKSLVDAKGDLLVGSANDTVSRLAVASTAGYVLTVDSAEATGLKWGAAPSAAFVGCSLYNSGAQTLANNTATAITFNSEHFDTDGFHSTSTNTSRITIPTGKSGYYLFLAFAEWSNSPDGRRYLLLKKNGSGGVEFETIANPSTASPSAIFYYITSAVAGDYFEIFAEQSSGGNLNIAFQNNIGAFQAQYLGA